MYVWELEYLTTRIKRHALITNIGKVVYKLYINMIHTMYTFHNPFNLNFKNISIQILHIACYGLKFLMCLKFCINFCLLTGSVEKEVNDTFIRNYAHRNFLIPTLIENNNFLVSKQFIGHEFMIALLQHSTHSMFIHNLIK